MTVWALLAASYRSHGVHAASSGPHAAYHIICSTHTLHLLPVIICSISPSLALFRPGPTCQVSAPSAGATVRRQTFQLRLNPERRDGVREKGVLLVLDEGLGIGRLPSFHCPGPFSSSSYLSFALFSIFLEGMSEELYSVRLLVLSPLTLVLLHDTKEANPR